MPCTNYLDLVPALAALDFFVVVNRVIRDTQRQRTPVEQTSIAIAISVAVSPPIRIP